MRARLLVHRWPSCHYIITWQKGQRISLRSPMRALIPFSKASPWWPNHLPKAPSSKNVWIGRGGDTNFHPQQRTLSYVVSAYSSQNQEISVDQILPQSGSLAQISPGAPLVPSAPRSGLVSCLLEASHLEQLLSIAFSLVTVTVLTRTGFLCGMPLKVGGVSSRLDSKRIFPAGVPQSDAVPLIVPCLGC